MNMFFFLWSALAPAPETPTKEQLDTLIAVADAELVRLEGKCRPGSGPDREAELAFMRMAEIRQLAIRDYPYGRSGVEYHSDDVHQAVQYYERAYDCNPGPERREYLSRGLEMVQRRMQEIVDVEDRLDTAPDYQILLADSKHLRERLAGVEQRPPCPEIHCSKQDSQPPPPSGEPEGGYRERYMGLFSLRVEVGGTFATWLREGSDPKVKESRDPMFVLSVAPGLRLLAGEKRRHVFGLGFRYSLLVFGTWSIDHIDRLAARFEYGFRLHPRWLSLHAGFEPGIQVHSSRRNFGHVQVEGWGALCTWNEAICVRLGGSASLMPSGRNTFFQGGVATLGLDLFRLTDNLLRAAEGQP